MDWITILFYIFIGITVGATVFILFTRNVMYAVLALLTVFLGIAGIYIFLHAEFLAITQLLLYIGGVVVLMLFGVMMTTRHEGDKKMTTEFINLGIGIPIGLVSLFSFYLLFSQWSVGEKIKKVSIQDNMVSTEEIGQLLFTDYLIVFELAGVLLLIALIGASVIAGKKDYIQDHED